MNVNFGSGLHAAPGRAVDTLAYEQYIGRWSRLFVPAVLAGAEVGGGDRVLDVAAGSGEAAAMALSAVERTGGVVCQLGLQFFPDPARGVTEFRRVLRPRRWAAVCVISTPERAPMWGILADVLSGYLPYQREALHLGFALVDTARLERLFRAADFRDVRVRREVRQGMVESFDDYWRPIEAGTGQIPQAYLALPESSRRAVREEVHARLSEFEVDGRLVMSVEMLIAAGQA